MPNISLYIIYFNICFEKTIQIYRYYSMIYFMKMKVETSKELTKASIYHVRS